MTGYVAFADVSGGRGTSFAAAIGHAEGNLVILDSLFERRPPFDPSVVVDEVAQLLREYSITCIVGDKYAAQWVSEAFAKVGITYVASDLDRSALYLTALPLFTAGRARLLDDQRLVHQFVALERRTTRLGRDVVGAPSGCIDDLANAVAGVLVLAATEAGPALIRRSDLGEGEAVEPHMVACVLAVAWVSDLGQVGVVYVALPHAHLADQPIYILDMALAPLSATVFSPIANRLAELSETFGEAARGRAIHVGLYVPQAFHSIALDAMLAVDWHDERAGVRNVVAEPVEPDIDPVFLADPARLHFAVAAHVAAGRVRLAPEAVARSKELPIMGALTGRLADRAHENPVVMAIWLATALQFEQQPSRRRAA